MITGGLVLMEYSDLDIERKSFAKVTPYSGNDQFQNHGHPKMQKPDFIKNLIISTCFNDDNDELETPDLTSKIHHSYTPVATHSLFDLDKTKMGRYYQKKVPLKLIIQRAMMEPKNEEKIKPSVKTEEYDIPLHRRSVMGIIIGVFFSLKVQWKTKSGKVIPCVE